MTDVDSPADVFGESAAEAVQPYPAPEPAAEEPTTEKPVEDLLAEDHAIEGILAEESLLKEHPAEEHIEEVLPIEFLQVEQLPAYVPAAVEPLPDPEPAQAVSAVQRSVETEAPALEPPKEVPAAGFEPVIQPSEASPEPPAEPKLEEAKAQPDELPEVIQRSVEPDPDPELDTERSPEPPPNVIEPEPTPILKAKSEPEAIPQAEEHLEVVQRAAQPEGLAAEAESAVPQLEPQAVPVSELARETPLPPISTKSAKPRKRDAWRIRLATGGNGKQRLLMFTAPRETKPLVAALQHEKAKGTDIKPVVDGMLAMIAS
ncbi:uncharacterized protein EKO05_0002362 [Ascochyta rabiei]|uniref:Uncharacterized protein n=1 Tax=Didymella rabiei TaxID=5454 RepID=A0A162VR26_DIDRA|nr:uncharacterized protein EKO05_0002362 [Ascochyta rabiei]KZM18585.1 hypothetical protein ST47_g10300 [Ascochyta rabiei]UPX11773.1 hypothetical protein EKO05_0002362 [Ascochyta rabiei]